MSGAPPLGKVTTMRTGLFGQAWAQAEGRAAKARVDASSRRRGVMGSLRCVGEVAPRRRRSRQHNWQQVAVLHATVPPMTPALDLQACLNTAWQATPDMALRSAIAAGLLAVAGWAGERRRFPGRRAFVAVTLVMAGWIAISVVEHAAVDAGCKGTVALFSWLFIQFQPPLYALFMYQYVNSEMRLRAPWQRALMAAPSVVVVALAWSNGWHGLFYGPGTALGPPLAGLPRLQFDYGPLFYSAIFLSYVWMVLAAVLVLRGLRAARPDQRSQWLVFLTIMGVPMAANLAYILGGWRFLGVDPTSSAFAVAVAGFAWLIGRHQLFAVVPLARRLLFAELPDPVLVLDGERRVVEANQAALRIEHQEPELDAPLASWPRLGPALQRHLDQDAAGTLLQLDDPPAWFEVQQRTLGDAAHPVGALVQLHDVSQRHQAHQEAVRSLSARESELHQANAAQAQWREQALRDPLTGLLNRRALEEHHAERARLAAADGGALSLVLLDLDHFKRVNDTHGHATGDAVLRDFAATLRQGLRADDALFRIGGEEFALLIPGTGPEAAVRRVDALRERVSATRLGGLPDTVTFSAGVSGLGPQAGSLDALLQAADQALYRAKRDGRNRTVMAEGAGG